MNKKRFEFFKSTSFLKNIFKLSIAVFTIIIILSFLGINAPLASKATPNLILNTSAPKSVARTDYLAIDDDIHIPIVLNGRTSLAIDQSTPRSVTGTGNLTTASFIPPANSVIVVTAMSDEGSAQTFTVTDNLTTHLTYHNIGSGPYGNLSNDGRVQAWWATNSTATPLTISLIPGQSGMEKQFRVLVFTGADTANPIGAVSGGRGVSGRLNQTYTSTVNDSWGWALYVDWNQKGVPTVPSDEALDSFYNPAGYISSAVIKQNSVTPLVGTPVTMSTLTPNADTQITWMYFEIRPTSQPVLTAPIINSFSASPASIVLNDSSILAWSVSGNPIPTLTIDHQVGDVSGQTSVSVSPTQTTIYTLTAQNGLGSATAQVTVTVFPQDNQPPSVPTGLSASATSYFQIDLSWIASTDNVGVTGYKIYRDGVQIGTSSVNSYSDTGLAPSTTYTYKVSAYDSSGNDSGQSDPAQATTQSAPTSNLTINAAVTYQTMNGVGSNINSWSWKNGELTPALDDLINTLGHNIFRVVHDRMEWAGSGNTRPAAVLTGLQNLDSATLQSVYEVSDMQDLWNTIAYLNSKGVSGDQIIVNFMGWTAPWMGGSGEYGVPSYITNNAQTNQDIATMIASLVYYGHHRRDVSGANQNLSFSYIAPFNEPNLNGLEGPLVSASQMNAIYKNIVTTLNTMGDTSTMILSPDTIGDPDGYTSEFSAAVIARMAHFSWHDYGGNPVNPATSRNGVNADWMTETSKWCDGCDNNQPPSESEWSFGSGTADIILGDIKNGFSAVLTWEGFDTFYYHHDSYSAWGHVGCTQNGSGCTTSDTYPRVYTIRGRAWPEATIARAISPGMVRRGVTTTNISHLTVLSFYDSVTGRFSIVGHNTGSSPITINGQLQNLPSINSLSLYETNVSLHLQHMNDVPVNNTLFTATIPPDTFFYLATTTGP